VELRPADGSTPDVAKIIPNSTGRLAQVHVTVTAANFAAAMEKAHDEVMPVLSRIAFEADTALEVTATVLTEQATQTRRMGAVVIGEVRSAPELEGLMTPELRPYLAAYREGLNSNSPLYQALSFYKIIEGVGAFGTRRARAAARSGGPAAQDPLAKQIPSDPRDLPALTEWEQGVFTPHLGKTFAEIKETVGDTVRNAIAHLTPGRDIRVADYLGDIRACRDITPVLRYIAHVLIEDELAALRMPGPETGDAGP
jgi:hypothetical protein